MKMLYVIRQPTSGGKFAVREAVKDGAPQQPNEVLMTEAEYEAEVAASAEKVREWDSHTFRNRFTLDEQIALVQTAAERNADGSLKYPLLSVIQLKAATVPSVHSDDPETQQYMNYLVALKLITAERKAEILND